MTAKDELIALAEKVDEFNRKAARIIQNDADLSAGGAAISLALLVTLNTETLQAIPAALRAIANMDDQP